MRLACTDTVGLPNYPLTIQTVQGLKKTITFEISSHNQLFTFGQNVARSVSYFTVCVSATTLPHILAS
jgi:hypothetical protein